MSKIPTPSPSAIPYWYCQMACDGPDCHLELYVVLWDPKWEWEKLKEVIFVMYPEEHCELAIHNCSNAFKVHFTCNLVWFTLLS